MRTRGGANAACEERPKRAILAGLSSKPKKDSKRAPSGADLQRDSRRLLLAGDCAGGWEALRRAFEADGSLAAQYGEGAENALRPAGRRADPSDLLDALDRGVRRQPKLAAARAWRGAVRRRRLDYAGAVEDLSRAWTLGERTAAVLTWLGEARFQTGDRTGGLRDMERALSLPCRAWNHAWYGRVKLTMGRDPSGLRALDRAVALEPRNGWLRAWRGEARRRLGLRGAMADFDRALALENGREAGLIFWWRGLGRLQQGKAAAALDDLTRAAKDIPAHPGPAKARAEALRRLGRRREWLEALETATRLDPRALQHLRGRPASEWESMAEELSRLLERAPRLAAGRRWRGLLLTWLGRPQEALADLDAAVRLKRSDAAGWAWRGAALRALGRATESAASLDRALTLQPSRAEAWLERSRAALALGDAKGALASLDRAAALDGGLGPAFAERGVVKLMLGRAKDAVPDFERALRQDPRDVPTLVDLSVALARAGAAGRDRAPRSQARALDRARADARLAAWSLK